MKPHIIFCNGRWMLLQIRQFLIFADGGAYYRLAALAQQWCNERNATKHRVGVMEFMNSNIQ